jgi:hypothetical protein
MNQMVESAITLGNQGVFSLAENINNHRFSSQSEIHPHLMDQSTKDAAWDAP